MESYSPPKMARASLRPWKETWSPHSGLEDLAWHGPASIPPSSPRAATLRPFCPSHTPASASWACPPPAPHAGSPDPSGLLLIPPWSSGPAHRQTSIPPVGTLSRQQPPFSVMTSCLPSAAPTEPWAPCRQGSQTIPAIKAQWLTGLLKGSRQEAICGSASRRDRVDSGAKYPGI